MHTYKPDFFPAVIWGQNAWRQLQEELNDLFNIASLVSFYSKWWSWYSKAKHYESISYD